MRSTDGDYGDRLVVLRGGLIVPTPAYLLLLDLEHRGLDIRRDGESLLVGPPSLLTDEDRARLRRWRWHLLLLIDYCQQPGLDAHLYSDVTPRLGPERRVS